MSASEGLPPKARWYVDEVRRALADLPESERDELMADVEMHVAEVSLETGDELVARLGSPETFAAELRAAAGLPADGAAAAAPGARFAARVRERLPSPASYADLAPVWWVARGYVAAVVLAVLAGGDFPRDWLPVIGPGWFAFALTAVSIAGSIWLGRRTRGRPLARGRRAALASANALGVLAALVVALHAHDGMDVVLADYAPPAAGLTYDGIAVENVYPVDAAGKPLHDVRLYDHLGRPLSIYPDDSDPTRRLVFDAHGEPVDNAFPIRYRDPATDRVEDPNAGYPVGVPPLKDAIPKPRTPKHP